MIMRKLPSLLLGKLAGTYLSIPKVQTGTFLKILAYHRVNYHSGTDFLFNDDVISCSPEIFDSQMSFCRKYFTPITFSHLRNCLNGEGQLPERPLIITFDDGYKDSFTYALPILKRYNLPATIFLTTGYIGKNELFWWDAVAYSIKTSKRQQLEMDINHSSYRFALDSNEERRESIRKLCLILKSLSNDKKNEVLQQLFLLTDVRAPQAEISMGWDDVREMCCEGIEFGSHTVTHPILTKISERDIIFELEESKKIIESTIDREVIAFAYPNGLREDFDSHIKNVLNDLGYRYAVSYINGINNIADFDSYDLKRISVHGGDLPYFKTQISFPHLPFVKAYKRSTL